MILPKRKQRTRLSKPKPEKTIIGLDLAEKTGVCVLSLADHHLIWSDSVCLAHHQDPGRKLVSLKELLINVIDRFDPEEVAIEDVFLPAKTSRRTPISLGELRGVARMCATEAKLPVFFYPPAKIKLAITGSGRAFKEDISRIIEAEFGILVKDHNEADAISVAYTHWLTRRFNQHLK